MFIKLISNKIITLFLIVSSSLLSGCASQSQSIGYIANVDGDLEVFVTDTALSNPKQLTFNELDDWHPCLGASGEWIAFVGRTLNQQFIRIVSLEGEVLHQVDSPKSNIYGLICMPVNNSVAYITSQSDNKNQINQFNVDTNTNQVIYSNEAQIFDFSYSFDERYLAFVSGAAKKNHLRVIELSTGKQQAYFDDKPARVDNIDWSHKSYDIAAAATHNKITDLWLVDTKQNTKEQFTELHMQDTYPVFSPDGAKIAWLTARNDGLRLQLAIADLNGDNLETLTPKGVGIRYAVWAKDGKEIVYSAFVDKRFQLYIVDIKTKAERPLQLHDTGIQLLPFFID